MSNEKIDPQNELITAQGAEATEKDVTSKVEKVTKARPTENDAPNKETIQKEAGTGNISKVFVVLNPVAGLTKADTARDLITQFCQEQGWECDLHETQKDEDLRQLVRDQLRQGANLVIVSGGDGTVSAVVSGIAKSKTPMVILPAGTGNALARDLGLPLSLEGALDLMRGEYAVRVMDVIEVKAGSRTDYFALNVSAGISAKTMKDTKRNEKRRFGMFAYLYRAFGTIKNSRMHRFEVRVDGKPHRFAASEVMVANSKLLGLEPKLSDIEIDPNDGRLDIFIVRAQGFKDYLGVLLDFVLRKKRDEIEKLRYLELYEAAEIRCMTPLPVQADGEVIGNTPVDIRLIRSALHILAPVPDNSKK